MGIVVVLQQQSEFRHLLDWLQEAWEYWSPEEIASVTGASLASVETNWPIIWSALHDHGIASFPVQAAAIATVAIETASTFEPVREAYWLDNAYGYEWAEEYRRTHLPTSRYWPYYGRGYIQLTWQSNYAEEGEAIGVDLVSEPDRALDPSIAADALARFFDTHGVADAAVVRNWPEVRRRVQGGYAALDRLQAIIADLGA